MPLRFSLRFFAVFSLTPLMLLLSPFSPLMPPGRCLRHASYFRFDFFLYSLPRRCCCQLMFRYADADVLSLSSADADAAADG